MKQKKHKVIIDKRYLKPILVGESNYGEAIAELVDNSIKAYEKNNIDKGCCEILIVVEENLIYIKDKSGGISKDVSDDNIFKIGKYSGKGMKKAVFRLGNEITIKSKANYGNRSLYLDFNSSDEELVFESRYSKFENDGEFGTEVIISSLDEETLKDINSRRFLEIVEKELSKYFGRKILSKDMKITIQYMGEKRVISPYRMQGKLIAEKNFEDLGINIKVYKKDEVEDKGVDFYINDYIIYNRVELVKIVENGFNFKNCTVEIIAYGNKTEILLQEEEIKNRLEAFIMKNAIHFKAKEKNIQYNKDLVRVEELMEYYDLKTAKAVGEKSFELLYNKYKDEKKKGLF